MTWLTWRLQRSLFVFFLVAAVIFVAFLIFDGLHTESLERLWNSPLCHGVNNHSPQSVQFRCDGYLRDLAKLRSEDPAVALIGLLICGIFAVLLGANLVASEITNKTLRVAWTQSIPRIRWLGTKLLVSVMSLAVVVVPVCLSLDWWISAVNFDPRVSVTVFSYDGWMPFVFCVFAFAVAVVAGVVVRRPGWAIAVAMILVLVVAWTMQNEVRTNLISLRTAVLKTVIIHEGDYSGEKPIGVAPRNSWIVFEGEEPLSARNTILTESAERHWTEAMNGCDAGPLSVNPVSTCEHKLGLRDVELYVADDEFWTLQLREGGIYVAGSLLFFGFCAWLLRRVEP